MEEKKIIRFINSNYKELFTIEDGEEVTVTRSNGETVTNQCFYIDEYHFRTKGGSVYHICQFAEILERNGSTCVPANRPLPEKTIQTLEFKVTVQDGDTFRCFKWTVTGDDVEDCKNSIRNDERTERTEYSDKLFRSWYGCDATVIELDADGNEIPEDKRRPLSAAAELPQGAVTLNGKIPFKMDEFYNMVAREYGLSEMEIEAVRYDPTKIFVSRHILDQQYVAAEEAGVQSTAYSMLQLNSGPKKDRKLSGNMVVVQDGFFTEAV